MESKKLGARLWVAIILIGLIGQLAWAIENQYINLWVFSQTGDANHISWMTTASAIVATATTFFMGALSDKLGKRKLFIALGYTIWGVMVSLFGVMSLKNLLPLNGNDYAKAFLAVGIMNVVVDCLMTFFGSTSNDAAFNAFVTDQTNEKNRPLVESIISVMPLFAMAIMFVVGGMLGLPGAMGEAESATDFAIRISEPWFIFFLAVGILTTAVGVACFFLLPKDNIAPSRDEKYIKKLVTGFLPKTIKSNVGFYLVLLTFLFFNIAVDSFMPYYLVYFQSTLGIVEGDFFSAMAIIIGVSSAIVIALGAFLDRIGKMKVIFPAILVMGGGALGFFLCGAEKPLAILSGVLLMTGYLVGTAALGAELRDQTPKNDVGSTQGVRMVFCVLLPMAIGANLSTAAFQSKYENEFGQIVAKPDKWMFIVTLGAALLAIIPAVVLVLYKRKKQNQEANVTE
ncbi:MAG: MFS transporter [Bacilli bacterium]|nr:MFS transporter [Bacilli bacterium]